MLAEHNASSILLDHQPRSAGFRGMFAAFAGVALERQLRWLRDRGTEPVHYDVERDRVFVGAAQVPAQALGHRPRRGGPWTWAWAGGVPGLAVPAIGATLQQLAELKAVPELATPQLSPDFDRAQCMALVTAGFLRALAWVDARVGDAIVSFALLPEVVAPLPPPSLQVVRAVVDLLTWLWPFDDRGALHGYFEARGVLASASSSEIVAQCYDGSLTTMFDERRLLVGLRPEVTIVDERHDGLQVSIRHTGPGTMAMNVASPVEDHWIAPAVQELRAAVVAATAANAMDVAAGQEHPYSRILQRLRAAEVLVATSEPPLLPGDDAYKRATITTSDGSPGEPPTCLLAFTSPEALLRFAGEPVPFERMTGARLLQLVAARGGDLGIGLDIAESARCWIDASTTRHFAAQ